jgi:hypothetical protein
MKRLVIYAALAVAAVVPATTGLLSNASFSQTVPVRTPAQAQLLTEAGATATARATTSPTPTTSTTSTTSTMSTTSPSASPTRHEEADDHGGDRDRTGTRTAEAGDDHGGDLDRDARQEIGDDRDSSVSDDDADDHGGDRGSDDGSHSGTGSGESGSDD